MLMTIINWILMGIAEGMDLFLGLFFRCFSLTPGAYLDYFPVLETSYKVFKGIGYGLVFVLAAVSLIKFFQPGLLGAKNANDTPLGILFKTAVASGLIYAGNYILEYIMYIAIVPYNMFNGLGISNLYSNTGDVAENIFCQLVTSGLHDLFGAGLTAGAVIIELVIVLMIAYNFFKLVVEIAERYLLVGLMLFTSPPFFALSASADTSQSFKSWIKMFISANVMMFVSVFSCKLVLSGIAGIATESAGTYSETFLRLLLILAMSKIAQHIDSYLRQLGLGTAETGGGLLEDILATGRMVGNMFSGSRSGRQAGSQGQTVLGKAGAAAMGAGFLGSNYMAGSIGEIKKAVSRGESPVLSKIHAAGKNVAAQKSDEQESRVPILKIGKQAMKNSDVINTANGVRNAFDTVEAVAKGVAHDVTKDISHSKAASAVGKIRDAVGNSETARNAAAGVRLAAAGAGNIAASSPVKAVSGFYSDNMHQAVSTASRIASAFSPGIAAQRFADRKTAMEEHKKAVYTSGKKYPVHQGAGTPLKVNENELLDKVSSNNPKVFSGEARDFYNNRGIEKGYTLDENGEIKPAPAAVASGMEFNKDERRLSNRNDAVTAEFLNTTYGQGKYNTFDDASSSINDYSDGRSTEEIDHVKGEQIQSISEIGRNTICASSPALAETMAMDPRYELSGDDMVGSAMINKLNGTDEVSYTDVQTQNMPSYTDEEGYVFSGGHTVNANYTDMNGNRMSYCAVNEAGYNQMLVQNPELAASYDRVEGKSGTVYYEKNEPVASHVPLTSEADKKTDSSGITSDGKFTDNAVTASEIFKNNNPTEGAAASVLTSEQKVRTPVETQVGTTADDSALSVSPSNQEVIVPENNDTGISTDEEIKPESLKRNEAVLVDDGSEGTSLNGISEQDGMTTIADSSENSSRDKSSSKEEPPYDIRESEFIDAIPYPEAELRRTPTQTIETPDYGYSTGYNTSNDNDFYGGEDYCPDGEQIAPDSSYRPAVIDPATEFSCQDQPFAESTSKEFPADNVSNLQVPFNHHKSGYPQSTVADGSEGPIASQISRFEQTSPESGNMSNTFQRSDVSMEAHPDGISSIKQSADSITAFTHEMSDPEAQSGVYKALSDLISNSHVIERTYADSQHKITELENKLKDSGIIVGEKLSNIHEYEYAGSSGWTADATDMSGAKIQYIGLAPNAWKLLPANERVLFSQVKGLGENEMLYIAAKKDSGERYAPQIRKISDRISSRIPPKVNSKGSLKNKKYGDVHMKFSGSKARQNKK